MTELGSMLCDALNPCPVPPAACLDSPAALPSDPPGSGRARCNAGHSVLVPFQLLCGFVSLSPHFSDRETQAERGLLTAKLTQTEGRELETRTT